MNSTRFGSPARDAKRHDERCQRGGGGRRWSPSGSTDVNHSSSPGLLEGQVPQVDFLSEVGANDPRRPFKCRPRPEVPRLAQRRRARHQVGGPSPEEH